MDLRQSFAWTNTIVEYLCSDAVIGYGPRPIPSDIDAAVLALAEAHRFGWQPPRERLPGRLQNVLLAFSERMASACLRHREARYLDHGAAAIDMVTETADIRDVYMALSLLHDAYQRLSAAVQHVDINGLPGFAREWSAFLERKIEDQSIESMGFIIEGDGDGDRYMRTW